MDDYTDDQEPGDTPLDDVEDWHSVEMLLHVCVMCADIVVGWCDHGGLLCDECCGDLVSHGLHAALPDYRPDPTWYGTSG